ncbi:hypothetical protein [Nocardia sp. NPDC003345]
MTSALTHLYRWVSAFHSAGPVTGYDRPTTRPEATRGDRLVRPAAVREPARYIRVRDTLQGGRRFVGAQ